MLGRIERLGPLLLTLLACTPAPTATTAEPAAPVVERSTWDGKSLDVDGVHEHVLFLADDEQGGRAPGTDADGRVQAYIERVMRGHGLAPAVGDAYLQTFSLTDGVHLPEGQRSVLRLGGKDLDHGLVPFSTSTQKPVTARLVYVGYGIATGGKGTGDYAGIERRVDGAIVVALHGGPDDPHLQPAATRPQSKVVTARDHGAVGFVLWDPFSARGYPNHGRFTDLEIPVVTVAAGSDGALAKALGLESKSADPHAGFDPSPLKPGKRGRGRARLHTPIEATQLETANVAGRLAGSGETDRVIVVGAHMDHLGMGTSSSLAPEEHAVHNGADDNASGVAVMLELARALASVDATARPYDVWFVAFGAEEMGLLGSKHFVDALDPAARARIVAMLNFDMVGRLRDDGLVVSGTGTSSVWPKLVEGTREGLTIGTSEGGYGPSDHSSFYEAEIPVLHFFTGPHEDYHRPSDDVEKLNLDGAAEVGAMAMRVIRALMEDRIEPDYVEVKREQPRRGGFRVSLGTVPDYAAKVDGVRLSGVRGGGPADAAGLQKGDVITKIAGREVHNLEDYMAAFATMKPGVEVEVEVERDGKRLTLKLTPAAPRR